MYTSEEREMKSKLYDVVQTVADRLRDAAGLRRVAVRKNDHATYLDDEEEEDEEDFFAEGNTNKKIVAVAGRSAAEGRSADDRLRAREEASAAAGGGSGLLGWLKLW